MPKSIVLYHKACADGALAAAVVLRALRASGETEIALVPAAYQKPLSDFIDIDEECSECRGDPVRHSVQRYHGVEGRWLDEGRAILRANAQQVRALAEKPEVVELDGVKMLAVNAPLHQDDLGDVLGAQCESGVGAMWYWRDGRYKISMRSRPVEGREPVDVSAIAMRRGGGGHRSAAGFTCDALPWSYGPGGLTHGEIVVACRNIGIDLTCGACAAIFYTEVGAGEHTCSGLE